jgi:predicted small lipoprotein YifL
LPDPATSGQRRRLLAAAVIGGAAMVLGGCGVKGPLQPPPASGIAPSAAQAVPEAPQHGFDPPDSYTGPNPTQRVITSGKTPAAVANAPAATRRSPLDWLVD